MTFEPGLVKPPGSLLCVDDPWDMRRHRVTYGDPVLWLPSRGTGAFIDRSKPVWTVRVGQLGAPTTHLLAPA